MSIDKRKLKTAANAVFLVGAFVLLQKLAKRTEEPEDIDADNIYLSESQVMETGEDPVLPDMNVYERFGKRALDKALSFMAMIALTPVYAAIALAIEIDDPGPVLFKQKRAGKDKRFFEIHKFRTMKMSAPVDVPAEQFEDQEKYVTKVGRFLRRTALDELPQLWDIFRGKMSFVGPRPVIWNTEDLIHERDHYAANSIMPGLTGLAQINGRDKLDHVTKARFDGEYVKKLRGSSSEAFITDLNCILQTPSALKNCFSMQIPGREEQDG